MPKYSGKSLGSFGELGGELSFEWVPDLDTVESEMLEISGYLENIAAPLLLSRGILQHDIRMRFETKVDPDGNPWEPWSENYARYREQNYPEGGILVRTGDLEKAATGDEAFVVSDAGIFYNTAGMPEYWLWNQEGSERSNRSASEGMTTQEITHMAKTLGISESQIRGTQSGKNTLPARPFVGVSFEAELEIIETFDKWFDGAIQLAESGKGKLFGRYAYRGPGGQFAKRA